MVSTAQRRPPKDFIVQTQPDQSNIQQAAFAQLPIAFQGLVVENTSRCTAKCGMCYQSAGPKGSDVFGIAALSVAEVEKVLRDALQIETLQRRFHLAGGEAFIQINDCIKLFQAAKDAGYVDITTTTNCYWARTPLEATQVCQAIREAGLTRMEISWDYWHWPYVSPDHVSNAVDACQAAGIRTNLRILTTTDHSIGEALALLRPESLARASEISSGPVFPTGRAATDIDRDTVFHVGDLGANCQHVLHLTVNAQGKVYPCCAGADQTEGLSFGNVREESIVDIANRLQTSPMFRVLARQGVGALVPILQKAGLFDDMDRHSNICHLCWDIFSDPARTQAVKDHFETLERRAFESAVEAYRHEHKV